MTDRPYRPSNPHAAHCPNCWQTFADIWAYKRHQDDCPGLSARPYRDPPTDVGELGAPPTAAEQAYLDDQDAANPADPDAEKAENALMFRAEVTAAPTP